MNSVDGLWKNSQDSIRHALEHFSELNRAKGEEITHHRKWALLSVHHAAECFSNMLLLALNPEDPPFSDSYYPSLAKSLALLETERTVSRLTPGERRLVHLLKELPKARNQIMHRFVPGQLEVSAAAMSLLGILRMAGNRLGIRTEDILDQSPPIEADVFAAIRYQRIEEYCSFAEAMLQDEYPGQTLEMCPHCQAHSIVHSHCEICFEEMDHITCANCDEQYAVPSWELQISPSPEIECPSCGHKRT